MYCFENGQESIYGAFQRKLRDDHGWDSVAVLEKWLAVLKLASAYEHQKVAYDAGECFWSELAPVPDDIDQWVVDCTTKNTVLTFEVLVFIQYGIGIEVIKALIDKMKAEPGVQTTTWLRNLKSWMLQRMTDAEEKAAHYACSIDAGISIINRLKVLMDSNGMTIEQAMKTINALPRRNAPCDSGRRL